MEGSPSLVEQISAIPQPGSPAAFDPSEFHDAVYEGDIDLVEEMIASGVPCDVVDGDGNTALLLAAEGEPLIVDALIKAGCNVNHQNEEGATALMSAVRYEDHDIVDALIKAGADPEIMDKHGQKAADMVTSADVAKALGIAQEDSEAKAPAAPNDTGRRASVSQRGNGIGRRASVANVAMDVAGLFIAISDGDADEVETALKGGVDINSRDDDLNTPLILAAEGEPAIVQLLLDRGADMDLQNRNGVTALIAAVKYEDPELAMMLIQAGASMDIRDRKGVARRILRWRSTRACRRRWRRSLAPARPSRSRRAPRRAAATRGDAARWCTFLRRCARCWTRSPRVTTRRSRSS